MPRPGHHGNVNLLRFYNNMEWCYNMSGENLIGTKSDKRRTRSSKAKLKVLVYPAGFMITQSFVDVEQISVNIKAKKPKGVKHRLECVQKESTHIPGAVTAHICLFGF